MKFKYIFLIACNFLLFNACEQVTNSMQKQPASNEKSAAPDWAKNANIYEVNIRQYTPEGTFQAFQEGHLERLNKMGVDILWIMPIFPISEKKRKATGDLMVHEIEDEAARKEYLGSYYSISDFRAINPEFGTLEDFKRLLNEAHSYGMKVILDWVPNHTGWDHTWIKTHPEYYTKVAGAITEPLDPETGKSLGWADVADLNYDNQAMRAAMIADLLYWVNDIGVDGFRMDIAHGVPLDFWQTAIPTLRAANEDIFMLAESELPEQVNSDNLFTMCYAWSFHHLMNRMAQSEDSLASIDQWLSERTEKFNAEAYLMHFITNHDENSWAGTVEERMGEAADAMAVLAFTLDGMPLIYSGQEEPIDKRLAFFKKDSINWGNYAKQDFYTTLLDLKHRNQALWNGKAGGKVKRIKTDNDQNIYAFQREKEDNRVLVILNLSNEAQTVTINCSNCEGTYSDAFTRRSLQVLDGQTFSLGAWAYEVLEK